MTYRKARSNVEAYRRVVVALYEWQKGVCAICRKSLPILAKGVDKLVLDHDHATDEIRGLVCTRCNILLGAYESELRGKMHDYLEATPWRKSGYFIPCTSEITDSQS